MDLSRYSLTVCGAFRLSGIPKGGQEIKTCIIANELERQYGRILRIDTIGFKNHLLLPLRLIYALITSKHIVILPAYKGLILESFWLRWCNVLFNRDLHYVVIGGWLQDYLTHHSYTAQALHRFKGIYVETRTMKEALIRMGFGNVWILPNCKPLPILSIQQQPLNIKRPYRLCMFSRIEEKKGIGVAVHIIKDLNSQMHEDVYVLDLYGPVDPPDQEWFRELSKEFTSAIHYKGCVPFDKSVEVLSRYFALLFPTQHYTEGIPGTIIDAYAAGIPVIASRWKSFADVVDEGITGLGFPFNDVSGFQAILSRIAEDPQEIQLMKNNCLRKAEEFLPQNALRVLFDNIN